MSIDSSSVHGADSFPPEAAVPVSPASSEKKKKVMSGTPGADSFPHVAPVSPRSKKKNKKLIKRGAGKNGNHDHDVGILKARSAMTMGIDKYFEQAEYNDKKSMDTECNKVIVGSYQELEERRLITNFKEVEEEDVEKVVHTIIANIYYVSKWIFTILLTLLVGPFLAIAWGLVIAAAKFVSSWALYPAAKFAWILLRPVKSIAKAFSLPFEPMFELVARIFPTVHFSLDAANGEFEALINHYKGNHSSVEEDDLRHDIEAGRF